MAVNAKSDLKPIVTYHGDPALFSSFHAQLAQNLPTEAVTWQRSHGRDAIKLYLDPNFVPFSEDLIATNPIDKSINLHEYPFLHLFWTECNDIQQYKNGVKDQISSWLDLLSNNLALDWLVVVVSQHESSPFAKPRVNIIEKIKNDFCSKSAQSQRCIQLKFSSQHQETRLVESWQALLSRIRQLLLQSFTRNLPRLEEVVRSMRERRMTKPWNFCDYFILQEQLSFVFEMLTLYEDALIQYDELDAMFSQYVINTHAGEYPSWLSTFAVECRSWYGACLRVTSQGIRAQRYLIKERSCNLLQFRNYLFLRQAMLLFAMKRGFGIAERAFNFMHGCLQELKFLQVPIIDGGSHVWVYLSCVQVLCELEKLSSVELGLVDEKEIAHEKMFMLRANMLKYAWEKLQLVGTLCKALDGKHASLSECAIDLMHGIMGGDEGGIGASEDSLRLQAALCSTSDFHALYLELGQKTLDAYSHIGRRRFAAQVGHQLALFNLAQGDYSVAEPLLTKACQIYDAERWYLLSANVLVPLADCLLRMGHIEKYASTCSSLACFDPSLPDSTHSHYYEELVKVAAMSDLSTVLLPFEVVFELHGVRPTSDDSVFCTDEDAVVAIELSSSLIKPIRFNRISLSLHCKHSALESPFKEARDVDRRLTDVSVVAKVMEENKPNRKRRTSSRSEGDKLDVYCRTDSMATSASCGSINLLADESEESESRRELVEGEGGSDSIDALNQEQKEGNNKENGDDDEGDNDDDENLELIWLEVESPGELKPGFNTVLVRGKVEDEGQYYIRGLEIEMGSLQYILPCIPMPRRKQGLVILPRKTDVEVCLKSLHGDFLLVDVVQSIRLSVKSGKKGISGSSCLDLVLPPFVSVKRLTGAVIESDTEETVVNLISVVAEDGAPVKISLPPVDPLRVIHIDMQVVGSSAGATGDSRKADVVVSCLWVNPLLHCPMNLTFFRPFSSSHQLHATSSSSGRFLQLLFKNVFPCVLSILSVSCEGFSAGSKPLHALDERIVTPKQTMSYLWSLDAQTASKDCCCTVKYQSQACHETHHFEYTFSVERQ